MLKNITLSAEEELINKARQKAQKERTTLNETFRRWLLQYVNAGMNSSEYESLMKSLNYAQPGKAFSRDELNER
ncbi:hypothetical protein GF406_14720 [candidate division KSB1 bacterium]|nr:hypothetical protein [candidate division KSB1 bacterium]